MCVLAVWVQASTKSRHDWEADILAAGVFYILEVEKKSLNRYKLWASPGPWQRAREPWTEATFVHSRSLGLAEMKEDLPGQHPIRSVGSCLENQLVRGFTGKACIMCQGIQELLEAKVQMSRLVTEWDQESALYGSWTFSWRMACLQIAEASGRTELTDT